MRMLIIILFFLPIISYGKLDECSDSYLKEKLDFAVRLKYDNDNTKYESYFENDVPIILTTLISCMSQKKFEKEKAKIFFDFFLAIKGHASEDINSYLNKFFVKFQKDTRETILTYPKENSLYLAKRLKFSWDNNNYGIINQKIPKEIPKDLLLLLRKLNITIVDSQASPSHKK